MRRSVLVRQVQLELDGRAPADRRAKLTGWLAVTAALGCMLGLAAGPATPGLPSPELLQPVAAQATGPALTGFASEPLDRGPAGTPGKSRAERAELRKARKEAARAKREAARELRASKFQERREARLAKREAARERRAAALASKHDGTDERREARLAKREAARERRAAAKQERLERAQAKREERLAKREAARERRAAAKQERLERAEAKREAAREKRELAMAEREAEQTDEPAFAETKSFGSGAFAAASAEPPRDAGILRINSRPWAQVFVDGRMVGYTPQRSIRLSPGDHAVELINPEFAMRKRLTVKIARGKQVTHSELLED